MSASPWGRLRADLSEARAEISTLREQLQAADTGHAKFESDWVGIAKANEERAEAAEADADALAAALESVGAKLYFAHPPRGQNMTEGRLREVIAEAHEVVVDVLESRPAAAKERVEREQRLREYAQHKQNCSAWKHDKNLDRWITPIGATCDCGLVRL